MTEDCTSLDIQFIKSRVPLLMQQNMMSVPGLYGYPPILTISFQPPAMCTLHILLRTGNSQEGHLCVCSSSVCLTAFQSHAHLWGSGGWQKPLRCDTSTAPFLTPWIAFWEVFSATFFMRAIWQIISHMYVTNLPAATFCETYGMKSPKVRHQNSAGVQGLALEPNNADVYT